LGKAAQFLQFRPGASLRDHEHNQTQIVFMRKQLISANPQDVSPCDGGCLDLDRTALVEVTSEDKDYPVESALVSGTMQG
jgi:hypothetical protein